MAHVVSTLQVYDPVDIYLHKRTEDGLLTHGAMDSWPTEPDLDPFSVVPHPAVSIVRPMHTRLAVVYEDGVLGATFEGGGMVRVESRAKNPADAKAIVDRARGLFPRGSDSDPDTVSITFWTYSPHGPRGIRRVLDADAWEAITDNYADATAPALGDMMSPDFRPGLGGQLVLWHGDPGTGKTTALRALAREWRSWCDVHYVVDPERFFGDHADYMMDVLMGSGEAIDEDDEGEVTRRWRLLILEDCGEMLRQDAKREVGQALARFLNACDGLVGRGLRVLVLVTTNEEIGKLHDAVSRPGRCAAQIEFKRLSPGAASRWLEDHGYDGEVPSWPTLADLYAAISEGRIDNRSAQRAVGFAA